MSGFIKSIVVKRSYSHHQIMALQFLYQAFNSLSLF